MIKKFLNFFRSGPIEPQSMAELAQTALISYNTFMTCAQQLEAGMQKRGDDMRAATARIVALNTPPSESR